MLDGMSTNGTHTSISSEVASGVDYQQPPLDCQSVDERLEKLRETIRTWDWRAGLVEVGAPAPLETLDTTAPPCEELEAAAPPPTRRPRETRMNCGRQPVSLRSAAALRPPAPRKGVP